MHELYIMRHGNAHSNAPSDEQRALSPKGEKEVLSSAQQHLSPIHFDYVFVSPFLRAQQSFAQVESAGVAYDQLQTVSWVTPDVPTKPALKALMALTGDDLKILIVCHQTFAGRLASQLCDGHEQGMHLDTASIVKIHTEVFSSQCGMFQGMFCA